MVIPRHALSALASCLVLLACELDEITISQPEPTIVVHGVINVAAPLQFVILEQSLTGRSSQHYSSGLVPPAPAGEGIPIAGAYVTLTYHGTGSCDQPTVIMDERPPVELGDVGIVASGTYVTSELCSLSPGDRVDLRVETPAGDVVRGTTVIPGARSIDIHTRSASGANLAFDRTTDSVWIDVDPISARALAFELTRDPRRTPYEFPDYHYTLTVDTMSMVFAGDLKSFEDEDEGEAVFLPGHYLTLAVAVTDTNYYDFARSFSNPLTGRGFINHLQGGVGVFGSVLTSERNLRVTDSQDDAREGLYRISGTFDSVAVDVILDLYLEPYRQRGEFSAFVDGTWVHGPVSTSADGRYEYLTPAAEAGPGDFLATFATVSDSGRVAYFIFGSPSRVSSSFQAPVTSSIEIEQFYYRHFTDTLTVERVAAEAGPR
jgi:hypothetical protein